MGLPGGVEWACCLVIFVIPLALALVLLVWLRRPRKSPDGPACGQCGYAVYGLPTFICPECGSDLREVGIVTGGQPRPIHPVVKVIILTIVMAPLVLLSTVFVAIMSPQQTTLTTRTSVEHSALASIETIDVNVSLRTDGAGNVTDGTLTARLIRSDGPDLQLRVDHPGLAYEYDHPEGRRQGDELDRDALLDWWSGAGVDASDADVRDAADGFLTLVRRGSAGFASLPGLAATGFIQSGSSSSSTMLGPVMWYPLGCLLFWLIVWLIGVRYVLWGRRASRAGDPGR